MKSAESINKTPINNQDNQNNQATPKENTSNQQLKDSDDIDITDLTETLETFLEENNLNDIIEYVYSYEKTKQ
jgi:type I site-specific restriction-modification system R (restriction) subunit